MVAKKKVSQKVKEKTGEPDVKNKPISTLSFLVQAQYNIKMAVDFVKAAEKAFEKEHKKILRGK